MTIIIFGTDESETLPAQGCLPQRSVNGGQPFGYEYDVRGLVMAFYPGEAIEVVSREDYPHNGEPDKGVPNKFQGRLLRIAFTRGGFITVTLERGVKGKLGRGGETLFSDRKRTKSVLKRLVYDLLSEDTGKRLPWGTLTGIRPTKIAMGLLEAGESPEGIEAFMEKEYYTSQEKARLSVQIALREREILEGIDDPAGYSLYLGIPFCPTTCLYCSFTSYPLAQWTPRMDEYLEALFQEVDYVAEAFRDKKLNAIYIGGGTPTSLAAEQLDRLLTKLEGSFSQEDLREWTVEAGRPDSITAEKLQVIKNHPVDRISINPQTMKQETLDLIGRRHTVGQTVEAFHLARSLGFDNINMDLILGLPLETEKDVERTLKAVAELGPDNLTVHSLALKRASRLNQMWEQYADTLKENVWEMMGLSADYAEKMGMEPYYLYRQKNMAGNLENTGYARPGKAGIYNILMMEEKQSIVALGAGGTSKKVYPDGRIVRRDNVKDVALYIEKIDEMIERKRRLLEEL